MNVNHYKYSLEFYKEDLKDYNSVREFAKKGLSELKSEPTQKDIDGFLTKLNKIAYNKAHTELHTLSRRVVQRRTVETVLNRLYEKQENSEINAEESIFLRLLSELKQGGWYFIDGNGCLRLINRTEVELVVELLNETIEEMLWVGCYFGLTREEYEAIYKEKSVSQYVEKYQSKIKEHNKKHSLN